MLEFNDSQIQVQGNENANSFCTPPSYNAATAVCNTCNGLDASLSKDQLVIRKALQQSKQPVKKENYAQQAQLIRAVRTAAMNLPVDQKHKCDFIDADQALMNLGSYMNAAANESSEGEIRENLFATSRETDAGHSELVSRPGLGGALGILGEKKHSQEMRYYDNPFSQ